MNLKDHNGIFRREIDTQQLRFSSLFVFIYLCLCPCRHSTAFDLYTGILLTHVDGR